MGKGVEEGSLEINVCNCLKKWRPDSGIVPIIIFSTGDTDKHNADEFDESKRCNEECFKELWKNLDDEKLSPGDRQKTCQSLHTVSGAYMYSMLCRNILSDLKEHREAADTGSKKYRESS